MSSTYAVVLLLLLVAFSGNCQGKVAKLADLNLCIDLPDDWLISSDPAAQIKDAALFAADSAHSGITIVSYPGTHVAQINSAFIKDFQAGLLEAADTSVVKAAQPIILSVGFTYVVEIKTARVGKTAIFGYCFPLLINKKLYVMSIQSFSSGTADRLQYLARGLRFLTKERD